MLVSGEIADAVGARLRTACEPFVSAADAWSQTVEADVVANASGLTAASVRAD